MNRKLYACKNCGKEVQIRSKGLCSYCRNLERGSQTKRYIIKQNTAKNKEKKRKKQEIMQPYWDFHLENVKKNPYCENCGARLQGSIANIAHIIPKRSSVDVMDDLNNCLYLCSPFDEQGLDCHNKFDRNQTTTKVYLMTVWTKAVERYLLFKDKIVKYNTYTENFEQYIKEMKEDGGL